MSALNTRFTDSLRHLVGPSGGISYHLTARRYRDRLWRPFLEATGEWLDTWSPPQNDLIIFGPSAGWTLPSNFLSRFRTVVAVEPDPAARWLFRKRFQDVPGLSFLRDSDLLPWLAPRPDRFRNFLESHPAHAVLFSNLLGQIPLLISHRGTDDSASTHRREFFAALSGRSWASYHDLLSAHGRPQSTEIFSFSRTLSVDELAARVFHSGSEVVDHDTLWLSENRSTSCAVWQIRPHWHHLIGFVHS